MLLLVYASRTNNIEKIVKKLNFPPQRVVNLIDNPDIQLFNDFCLLTYTDLLGQIPEIVTSFLCRNKNYLKAVAGSGNRNFGENFCGAAKKIQFLYEVPLWATFELSGDDESIFEFQQKINNYGK